MIIYFIKRINSYLKVYLPLWGKAAAYAINK